MTIKSRTIDNLGIETSVRYAKDQEAIDNQLLNDSRLVSRKIEIPVTKAYVPSEFDQMFSYGRSTLWALFSAPPEYESYSSDVFSHQLIPSLGTSEKQEAGIDKIEALEDAVNKKHSKKKNFLDEREEKEEEDERKALSSLLKCIERLDQTLVFINARRNQYHRG
jgi:hypothetical protein